MTDRESSLRKLAVGDIFHARSPNGASLVCLVTSVDDRTIYARRIHTQDDVRFDRTTGLRMPSARTRIDCVAPFPPDLHNIFLEVDRKHRELTDLTRQGVELTLDQTRMTDDEKRANLSINQHVADNPI
ncbi:MAG: hypothetical protein WB697_05425 [Stellaceae bacterium]